MNCGFSIDVTSLVCILCRMQIARQSRIDSSPGARRAVLEISKVMAPSRFSQRLQHDSILPGV